MVEFMTLFALTLIKILAIIFVVAIVAVSLGCTASAIDNTFGEWWALAFVVVAGLLLFTLTVTTGIYFEGGDQ